MIATQSPTLVPRAIDDRAASRWRLARWVAAAWRRMTWRHVLLAFLLAQLWLVIGPNGGYFFFPGQNAANPLLDILTSRWAVRQLMIVFFTLVADAAVDDGATQWLAYGAVVMVFAVLAPAADLFIGWLVRGTIGSTYFFWSFAYMRDGGIALAVYAYWRNSQRSLRQKQLAETARVRTRQQLEAARLMAMQTRVEPRLLFDVLTLVHSLHETDAPAADRLLASLIALLRAMLPEGGSALSTVRQEFALVEAWLQVRRQSSSRFPSVRLSAPVEAMRQPVAPMLVLPLLRAALAHPCEGLQWSVEATTSSSRLTIVVTATGMPEGAGTRILEAAMPDLLQLRERIAQLHGEDAFLDIADPPPTMTLRLPKGPRRELAPA